MYSCHFRFLTAAVRMPGQFRASVLINKLAVFFCEYMDEGRGNKTEAVKTATEASM
jgi:hypothetical protein